MRYDDLLDDRRERFPSEDHAEQERMRREARTAFYKAARTMRRRTIAPAAGVSPVPERIDRSGVVLEPRSCLLSRAEIERMAAEVAADYCGVESTRGIR
jgi:hypothetical protein